MPVVAPLALFIATVALVVAIFAIALKPTEPVRPVAPPPPPPPPQKDVVHRPADTRQDVEILINRIVDLEGALRTEKADNFLLRARLSEANKDTNES